MLGLLLGFKILIEPQTTNVFVGFLVVFVCGLFFCFPFGLGGPGMVFVFN